MDVKKVAQLSRVELSENECEVLEKQFGDILTYIHKISELDTSGVEPASHPFDLKNVFRDDVVREPLGVQVLMRLAPKSDRNMFHVPKVIETKS